MAPLLLWEQYVAPLKRLFLKPNFSTAVIFIIFFKVGEAMLVAMANPFWIDRGFTPGEIGFVVGTLGTLGVGLVLACFLGGARIARRMRAGGHGSRARTEPEWLSRQ